MLSLMLGLPKRKLEPAAGVTISSSVSLPPPLEFLSLS